jgi:hypothetical protein
LPKGSPCHGNLGTRSVCCWRRPGGIREGSRGFPTALAYGAWAADTLLPNVITFTPGTVAYWEPWFDVSNGKGVIEDIASN